MSCGRPGSLNMGSKTALCTASWSNVRELGPQVPQIRPTWAKLGQLSTNFGPTWVQLGAPEAKSDCIFTVFFKVCVKIELSLPRAAPEAPRDAQEALGAGQERPGAAQDQPKNDPRAAVGLGFRPRWGQLGPTWANLSQLGATLERTWANLRPT